MAKKLKILGLSLVNKKNKDDKKGEVQALKKKNFPKWARKILDGKKFYNKVSPSAFG